MTETLDKHVPDDSSRSGSDASSRADSLYAEYLSLREAGESVEFREWVARYPTEARELEELHAGWSHFESNLGAVLERRGTPAPGSSRLADGEAQRPALDSPLQPGLEIGDFQLERQMSAGGMGQVWAARQKTLRRTVALKFIRPEKSSESYVELFAREARAAGRINHPGIVTVHEHGEADGVHWIAMELVEGERTLADDLLAARALEELPRGYYRDVARRFLHIARAMHAAHEGGIVHRDVKPRNILITREGLPKVTDFGLARIEDESRLNESMGVVGSAYYMSPEQALGKSDRVDRRSDVFSLGVVLYEALTLQKAFDGETVLDVLRRIVRVDPPDAHAVSRRVPAELALICARAMEKRRRDRFQTMELFASSLEAYLENRPLPISPPGPLVRLRKWALRHPTASSVAGLALVSAVAVVWLLFATLRAERDARERAEDNAALVREMRAQQLVREAASLGPVEIGSVPSFERWIAEVRELEALLPGLRAELAGLRATGERRLAQADDPALIESGEEVAELEGLLRMLETQRGHLEAFFAGEDVPEEYHDNPTVGEGAFASVERRIARETERLDLRRRQHAARGSWTFEDPAAQRRHDHLAGLLPALEGLCHPGAGRLGLVEARCEKARTIARVSLEDHEEEWRRAVDQVVADYGLVGFRPQEGLVPLGPDPFSGLQEFWHVLSGERPRRDGEGLIEMRPDSGLVLVLIPGGEFPVGSCSIASEPNFDRWRDSIDQPQGLAEIEPYFLSKYEMTQGQWLELTGVNPAEYSAGKAWRYYGFVDELHPVERVSWLDCQKTLAEVGLELPSELQWERAARAGGDGLFWTGNDFEVLSAITNFADRSWSKSDVGRPHESGFDDSFALHAPVHFFEPNPFGLFQVTGNVEEWCRDSLDDQQSSLKMVRGGSLSHTRRNLVVARRRVWPMDRRWRNLGVRPARAVSLKGP